MFVSGTTGFDYATMTIAAGVVEQAEQCLANIAAALEEAGCTLDDVVRVRYMLPGAEDFEPCWPVLRRAFGEVRPAATMMACGLSDPRMRIEIEVTARRPGNVVPLGWCTRHMRRLLLFAIGCAAVLLAPSTASAKEIAGVSVCGE